MSEFEEKSLMKSSDRNLLGLKMEGIWRQKQSQKERERKTHRQTDRLGQGNEANKNVEREAIWKERRIEITERKNIYESESVW